jgi:hypothetical protein
MKRVIKLKESDLTEIIKRVLSEGGDMKTNRYMFFSNLEQIKRQAELLLDLDENVINEILENGHDWADDHITVAKENLDQVFDFLMNETNEEGYEETDVEMDAMMEGRKKTGTKLCARGKASAKAKYDVYPSAYSNGHAVQVCKGKIKGLDGKKYCSGVYC